MTKTATTPERVEHILFGRGSVIEARITESGKSVCLVRFDASETDRLILAESLKPSTSSAPVEPDEAPKKGRKKVAAAPVKKTRARKIASTDEPITDKLLVPELDDALIGDGES
jgi:hypothetical protein